MSLRLVHSLLALSAFALLAPASVQAQQISRNNPYRSFNISGINYASEQWEREHRAQTARPTPAPVRTGRGLVFRRR